MNQVAKYQFLVTPPQKGRKKSDYGQANDYFCLVHVFSCSYVTNTHCLLAAQ